MPLRSMSTGSATLMEVDVPQSPKHWTAAAQAAIALRSLSARLSLGAALRIVGPAMIPKRSISICETRVRKKSALTLLLSTNAMRLPLRSESGRADGTVGCSLVTSGSRRCCTAGSSMLFMFSTLQRNPAAKRRQWSVPIGSLFRRKLASPARVGACGRSACKKVYPDIRYYTNDKDTFHDGPRFRRPTGEGGMARFELMVPRWLRCGAAAVSLLAAVAAISPTTARAQGAAAVDNRSGTVRIYVSLSTSAMTRLVAA